MGASALVRRSTTVSSVGTSWAAFVTDGSWDLTIPAAAGDVIEVGFGAAWAPLAAYAYVDVVTMVSGTATNWVSTGGSSHVDGMLSLFQNNVTNYVSAGGSAFYTVQSGDIVSGQVTFRAYGKVSTGTRTLEFVATDSEAVLWAAVCDNAPVTSTLTGTASTTWTAYTGTATVAAAAGDVLACTINATMSAGASSVSNDAATMVSGSPVNWFSTGGSSHSGGVGAWRAPLQQAEPVAGTALYTVQSGDVVSGQVTVQIYGIRTSVARAINASSWFTVRKV